MDFSSSVLEVHYKYISFAMEEKFQEQKKLGNIHEHFLLNMNGKEEA
jgi:hypothetical protein